MPTEQPDPVADLLRKSPATPAARAAAWDAFNASANEDEFAEKLKALPLPQHVKANLWDLKAKASAQVQVPMNFALVNGQPEATGPTLADRAVELLPAAGGLVGGILGGIGGTVGGVGVGGVPGAVGGAALGGAAGESFKQLINRARGAEAPQSAGEAAQAIGTEGAIQGATELAGGAIAGGARVVGRGLMENAIRPAISVAKEFPHVVETAIAERIPVGRLLPGAQKGSEIAKQRLMDAAQAVKDRLTKFGNLGVRFDPAQETAQPLADLMTEIGQQPLGDAEQRRLTAMINEFLKRHPGPLTPAGMKELKQKAQAIAQPIYRAAAAGNVPSAEQSLTARFNSAVASGAKDALETLPGVAEGEARTKALIGVKKAVTQAELRRMSLMAEGITGSASILAGMLSAPGQVDEGFRRAVLAWGITRGVLSPRTMSRGALVLTQPQMQALFKQFPRLAEAVIEQAGVQGAEDQSATPAATGR